MDEAAIQPASTDEWPRTLWILLHDLDESARVAQISSWMQASKNSSNMFRGLYHAVRADQTVGAVWAQEMAGSVGVLWAPRVVAGEQEKVLEDLHEAAHQHWLRHDTRFVQVLLSERNAKDEALLRQFDFRPLVNLDYLQCDLPHHDDGCLPDDLTIRSYQAPHRQELLSIIEDTYQDSLDCPEMDDVRPLEEVLDGYQATGNSHTEFWYTAVEKETGRAVGCLLLARHDSGDFELVYVGITPSSRGRNWGRCLTEFAKDVATQHSATAIILAVDQRNHPAIKIYRQLGFFELGRRYIWKWENHV